MSTLSSQAHVRVQPSSLTLRRHALVKTAGTAIAKNPRWCRVGMLLDRGAVVEEAVGGMVQANG